MKKQNKTKFLFLCLTLAAMIVMVWSCKDDDPSLAELRNDRIAYLEDSLRISDSLRMINAAGIVNYAINVVDGSTSSIYQNYSSRTSATKNLLSGAIVTISQFGKTLTDSTDASGMVVFNGFFRSAVNITIRKEGFTSVSYVSAVNIQDSTGTGTVTFVGNLIPIFPLTGPNTATISGRATFESDLTNRVREFVPQSEGNIITASIDATDSDFEDKFLTDNIQFDYTPNCGCEFIYVGNILQASYQTGVIGSISNATGDYTVTVPAAIDGLPLSLSYSDIAADQRLFQLNGNDQNAVNKRVVFVGQPFSGAASVPVGASPTITFESFTAPASALAIVSATTGSIRNIEVTNGGNGYTVAPVVEITGGGGTGATATANLGLNGTVSSITIVSAGSGYTSIPTVTLVDGVGASASTTLAIDGTVTGVAITNTGAGYAVAPTVTFSAPGGSGVTATGTAVIANGRVTGVTITNAGSGYTGNPTVTFAAAPPGGVTATGNGIYSGQSIAEVAITNNGTNYATVPVVTFSAPQRANGVRATATAQIDAGSRQVIGITITNAGLGYTAPPTITISDGGGAAAQASLTGGSVISFDITSEGAGYAYPPTVVIGSTNTGNGSGATGTAIMENGRVVGINVVSGGSGYTSAPSVELVSGNGAVAYAIVNESGAITGFNLVKGGNGYNGNPRVLITGGGGTGATATATATGGVITGLTVTNGGSRYEAGNTPNFGIDFSSTYNNSIETRPGLKYVNDIYYGTGTTREQ
jgi:hypothetical protein